MNMKPIIDRVFCLPAFNQDASRSQLKLGVICLLLDILLRLTNKGKFCLWGASEPIIDVHHNHWSLLRLRRHCLAIIFHKIIGLPTIGFFSSTKKCRNLWAEVKISFEELELFILTKSLGNITTNSTDRFLLGLSSALLL